jgi:hypothetical protein
MTTEEIEAIEEAYDTRIGPDASVIRRLLVVIREMKDEMDAIDFAMAGGYVPPEQIRASFVADLLDRCKS